MKVVGKSSKTVPVRMDEYIAISATAIERVGFVGLIAMIVNTRLKAQRLVQRPIRLVTEVPVHVPTLRKMDGINTASSLNGYLIVN